MTTPTGSATSSPSSGKNAWPTVHPQKQRLEQIKNIRQGKDPNAEPPPPSSSASGKEASGELRHRGEVPEPTRRQLYVVGLHQAIPFVGFGIMDNAILVLAGEAIDVYLGVTLGISTMCAAAIGNIISDICGVVFGTVIEDALLNWSKSIERTTGGRIKLPPMPKLSYEQRNLRSVRWSSQLGCAVGLTVGCIIGMFPLLFFPEDKRSKHDKEGGDAKSTAKKTEDRRSDELKEEISRWKGKHQEVLERLRVLEKEKNDGLWDRGY